LKETIPTLEEQIENKLKEDSLNDNNRNDTTTQKENDDSTTIDLSLDGGVSLNDGVDVIFSTPEEIKKQMIFSFYDNNSMPFHTVNGYFLHGYKQLETYNYYLDKYQKRKTKEEVLLDFNKDIYGISFVSPFRSLPNTPISMNMMEFLSLKEGQLIENMVVEIYLVLLNSKEVSLTQKYKARRKNYFMSTYFYQMITTTGFDFANDLTLPIKYLNYETIFFPYTNNKHWILFEIKIDTKEIFVFDSTYELSERKKKYYGHKIVNNPFIEQPLENIIKWLNYEHNEYIEWSCQMGECAVQTNDKDCGVYMLTAAIFLCEQLHSFINEREYAELIPHARFKIAIDIYSGFIFDDRINEPILALMIHEFKSEIRKSSTKLSNSFINKIFSGNTCDDPIVVDDDDNKFCSLLVRENNLDNFVRSRVINVSQDIKKLTKKKVPLEQPVTLLDKYLSKKT
jgi:Ulp1 family protease